MIVKQFVDSIKNDNRFSVLEKVAIYEYIFSLTDNRRLADCVNKLRHINRLVDGVEDYVVSCTHTTRLDIGAAKNTMLSPSSSDDSIVFWGEKYISDVDTNSELIAKLCESDLDVSIIQYLVRNKDAVAILEQYAQNGKVFFLDASAIVLLHKPNNIVTARPVIVSTMFSETVIYLINTSPYTLKHDGINVLSNNGASKL